MNNNPDGNVRPDTVNIQMAILNVLPAHIALLDLDGTILAVNDAWRSFASSNALMEKNHYVGYNYLDFCDGATGECATEAKASAEGIRSVLNGTSKVFSLEYPCHSPTENHWFCVIVTPLGHGQVSGAVVMHIEVTDRKEAEAKVRASEASLVLAQRIARVGSWDWDVLSDEMSWSDQARQICGVEHADLKVTYPSFLNCVHPEDRAGVAEVMQQCVSGIPYEIEYRILWSNGAVIFAYGRGEVVARDAKGRTLRVSGMIQDITNRKLAENALAEKTRALKLLSRCNEALIRSGSEKELLKKICETAVEVGGFHLAWVGYVNEDDQKSIAPQAFAGYEEGYLSEISISWDADSADGQGPVGKTIREGTTTVIPDLSADDGFKPWLEAAQARGYRGIICLPLKDDKHTLGILILYMPEVRHPQQDELAVLQELADDLTFGIVNLRDRFARRRMQAALLNVATAVSAVSGKPFFDQLAEGMASALDAHASFVVQFLPGEPLTARTIAAVVGGKHAENFDYVMEGTPCEQLLSMDTCVVNSQVAQQFPRSPCLADLGAQSYVGRRLDSSTGKFLGLLFVLFRNPLQDPDLVVAMLQIFAARAASELERLKTDARVREQAELLDKARDGIFLRDLDHKILYWNKGAERLYGIRAEEAMGRDLRELIPHDRKALNIAFQKLLKSGEVSREIEHVIEDSRAVVIERHCSLVNDDDGAPQSVLSINSDITERKKIEAQYLRAQRMESIGTLAGGIAHDLNNVLAPIMMSIELLKMQEQNTKHLELLDTIQGSAKRGADMVQQVLSFARGVEGRRLEINIGSLIKEVHKIVQDTFEKNIEIHSAVPQDLWLVRGDPTQLHQVLINLCVNSRHAMADGGTLKLTSRNLVVDQHDAGMIIEAEPGSYVCIEVEDSGCGMPPEVLERIFEPFFTTKDVGQGTGLGLPSALAIIKSHGGFIRVYSEVDVGSRFQIHLPAEEIPGTMAKVSAAMELPRGKGELVLVVDDEASVRHVTQQTLEAFGYRVMLASDGIEATSIYASRMREIGVVLTDMMMPLMDGPTMIQVLLRLNPNARIIAASGLNSNGAVVKATCAGVKHFISKPYTAETILKTLREILDEPH